MVQPTSTIDEQSAQLVKQIAGIPAWCFVGEYLTNGDSNNMAVDGSGGNPQVFSYPPPANYNLIISRVMVFLQTSTAMSVELFGDLVALSHGIEIKSDGVLISKWQDNIDLYLECYDADALSNVSSTPTDTTLHLRWTLSKDLNGPGLLVKDVFEIIINDNLSDLVRLRTKIKGKLIAT